MLRHQESALDHIETVSSTSAQNFVAGCIGGAAGVLVGYPFDTVRVRLQNTTRGVFSSAMDCFIKTINAEGASGLYKGMVSPLFSMAILKALMFGSHDFFLRIQPNNVGKNPTLLQHTMAGMCAGLMNSLLCTPVDRAKIILQVQDVGAHPRQLTPPIFHGYRTRAPAIKRFTGPVDVIKKLGLAGMYRGFYPSAAREIVGCATYFTTYELLSRTRDDYFRMETKSKIYQLAAVLLSGSLTGVATWTMMFPLDTIKSRMQAQTGTSMASLHQIVTQLYREDGTRAFYRGWRAAVMRAIPAHAAILGTYELVMRLFTPRRRQILA
eukprot:TRINITY_DN4986_c0_g1_i1.p1 TRINITY_DN4986_c0_g1~~TRINITY_DN4986_c0_g1_i1.p1  ORF type:complete len:324 (+),score=12.21 TRINITY_DN4986_c0_g1_i1:297-1268(+)